MRITTGRPALDLPDDAVTQTFGILAVRGAGKTNTAVVMAEEMHKAGLPFVVVDPVGAWHGIRSSVDGKSPGLSVPVFGGRYGDVPLERNGGQLIADLVVDERLSCVLDVSEFTEGDKIHFLIDFAERLYRRNEEPLHMFLEEADDYAPQRPMRDQARLLGSWQRIVRRGRQRGLGITMITQRSAALNKDVLTQIETLIVLRTTSPQDRKAISGWVEYHAISKELLESLPVLDDGEAWVWSPHWLKLTQRFTIRRRKTFDSAATPKRGRKRRPATLADVDLEAIKIQMAETIERAKAEDPKELQKRVQKLEAELAKRPETEVQRIEVPVSVFKDGEVARLEKVVGKLADLGKSLVMVGQGVTDALLARPPVPTVKELKRVASKPVAEPPEASVALIEDTELSDYAKGILQTMAERHPTVLTRSQVAVLSRRSARSSAFAMAMRSLVQGGWVERVGKGFRLSERAMEQVGERLMPMSAEGVREEWLRRLPDYESSLLRVLIETYPGGVSREELASRAGRSNTSSAFTMAVRTLVKNQLAESEDGYLKASGTLFE